MQRLLRSVAVCVCLVLAVGQMAFGEVELTYWSQTPLVTPELVERFHEKYPDIKINVVDVPADEMRQMIRTALASGSGPDIFYFELGAGHVQSVIDAGLIVNLDEYAKEYGWFEKLQPFSIAEATHQGILWAIPNETEFIAMFYNKKIFKELGVTVPTTWDELAAIAEKAEAAGYIPISLGVVDKWPALHRISLGYQWGDSGREAVRKGLFEAGPFSDDNFAAGFERLMMLDGQFMQSALQMTSAEAAAAFNAGQAAMFHMGTWHIPTLLADTEHPEDFDLFIAPRPGTDIPDTVAGNGGGWYINSQTKHLEEALTFLKYCISDEGMAIWVEKGYIPPYPFDLSGAGELPDMQKKAIDALNKAEMGYFIHHFVSPESVEWIRDGYQALLAGQVTPAEFAEKFDEVAKQARKDGFRP